MSRVSCLNKPFVGDPNLVRDFMGSLIALLRILDHSLQVAHDFVNDIIPKIDPRSASARPGRESIDYACCPEL